MSVAQRDNCTWEEVGLAEEADCRQVLQHMNSSSKCW